MSKLRVGILRGGPSSEYDISLRTGGNILTNIDRERFTPVDIFISKDGSWHANGVEVLPGELFGKIDVAFNATHGGFGEDGKIQQVLEHLNIPYTGSEISPSAIGMNKIMSKELAKRNSIKTPVFKVIEIDDDLEKLAHDVFRSLPLPVIIKPVNGGSSIGVSKARNYDEIAIGLALAFEHSEVVIVEEFIVGREATCGVIDGYRGEKNYSMFPLEIRLPSGVEYYDFVSKYSGVAEEICPGNFSKEESEAIQNYSRQIHDSFGLRHYSRSDFIVSKRGIYFLEVNSQPGLTENCLFTKSLESVGDNMKNFISHVVDLAINNK